MQSYEHRVCGDAFLSLEVYMFSLSTRPFKFLEKYTYVFAFHRAQ